MSGAIVSGVNAVCEALQSAHRVHRVYVAPGSRAHGLERVFDLAHAARVPVERVPPAKLNVLAGSQEHQGVAAAISPVAYTPIGEIVARAPQRCFLLALDQVQHPKNVGMLLRTALGAGAGGVLLPVRGGALLDESIVRASAGAALRVPVALCPNLPQTLRQLRDAGFWSFALAGDARQTVFATRWPDRCVLVLGNETEGVRPVVRKACDEAVSIPLAAGLDSLNVAVAAGVTMFQVAQAQRAAP